MKAKKTLVIMLLTLTVFIPTKSFAINWFWESWGNSEEIGISEDKYEEEESEDDTVEDASKTNSTSRSPQEIAESYGWTYDEENMAFCYGNIIF